MPAIPTQLPPNSRIIEGVMSTVADADRFIHEPSLINIAPMGPIVDETLSRLILRPFTSSTTYRNLKSNGQGVFHITDDALLIARGAIGKLNATLDGKLPSASHDVPVRPAKHVRGVVLTDACRACEFHVTAMDDSQERTHIEAAVKHVETLREFLGFNRANHAVLEAAILATRIHLTGPAPVLAQYDQFQVIVDKTGDADAQSAMRELRDFVESGQ